VFGSGAGRSSLPAVRIEINPTSLSKYGVGLESVRAAIAAANANSPTGALEVGDRRYQLYSNDQARTVEEYRPAIIAWRTFAGTPVGRGRGHRFTREHPQRRQANGTLRVW